MGLALIQGVGVATSQRKCESKATLLQRGIPVQRGAGGIRMTGEEERELGTPSRTMGATGWRKERLGKHNSNRY